MKPHCHILGAGAIGGLFAARLTALGFRTTLIERDPPGKQRTLKLVTGGHEERVSIETESPNARGPVTLLWVATKSHAVLEAVSSVAHRLTAESVIVSLSNGLGYHEALEQKFPNRLIAGFTTAGVARVHPNKRLIAGQGQTRLGWWHGQALPPDWCEALVTSGWHCSWAPDIQTGLLEKLALNGVINPATALLDIPNGALLEPHHRAVLDTATAELCAQLVWAGHSAIAASLGERVQRVLQDTASNSSSMRTDRQQGRPTEHEEILGYLLERLGPTDRRHCPAAPLLQHWLSELRQPAPDH